jgi:MYXO-CTERM domain-containing protein
MTRSASLASILLLAFAACTLANSEEETLDVRTRPLFYSTVEPFVSGSRALQGSRACVEVSAVVVGNTYNIISPIEACYAITYGDEPFEDGSCVDLDVPGEALFEYVPLESCPFEGVAAFVVPDRYRVQVVAADGLRGRLEWAQEDAAARWLDPGPRGRFPTDWVPPGGEPLQLVPDVEVSFPVLIVDTTGGYVAWDLEQGRVYGSREDDGSSTELVAPADYPEYFPIVVGEGQRRIVELRLPGLELPVAEVIATPADAAASLEISVGYRPGVEPEPERWRAPVGARAVVRDAEGRVILGAPVQWTLVEGHLVMGPTSDEVRTPPEYLGIADDCEPPPATAKLRRATLRAELGTLMDELELEWTALPEDDPSDEPFEPSSACQRGIDTDGLEGRGCGCTTKGADGARWLAWGLLVLGAVRARRRGVRSSSGLGGLHTEERGKL